MDGPGVRSAFVVVNGEAAGTRLVIPHGKTTIGSDERSRLRLPVSGVSRRHALLTSLDGRTLLDDQDSRNGTWVNGHAITSPTELTDGDEVQFGQVRLRFVEAKYDGGSAPPGAAGGPGSQQPAPAVGRKKGLGAALLFAAAINVVGLIGNGLTAFLTELTPTWTWFVTPAMGLAVALGGEALDYLKDKGEPAPKRPKPQHRPSRRVQPARPARPLRPGRPDTLGDPMGPRILPGQLRPHRVPFQPSPRCWRYCSCSAAADGCWPPGRVTPSATSRATRKVRSAWHARWPPKPRASPSPSSASRAPHISPGGDPCAERDQQLHVTAAVPQRHPHRPGRHHVRR